MNLSTAGSQLMQNKYEYDKVDNILSLINSVNPQTLSEQNTAKLGGMSTHRYQYDELNRLISAQGKAKSASYDMSMTFNAMSMPTSKVQTVDSTETAQSYHNTYLYDDKEHPTAPTQIGNDRYEYDANGNPTLVTNDSLNTTRELYWDEENRLMVLSDNGKTSRYTYNHAGDRIIKSHGDLEGVYINGAPQGITFHENDEFTLYPASIISVNKNRFTKHYFIGSQRIASKLGSGRFNNVYGRNGSYITAGQQDYAERLNQIESQREEYYKELGIPPGVPTMKGAFGEPENTGVGYNTIITELGDHSVPKNWEQYVVKRDEGETPGPPIIWGEPQSPEDAQPGYGYVADDATEEETFFYHSDHLGSTSYITDQDGNITQYNAYLPYGELLVDEHSSSEELPYKFNGKELDEETGLYYYGARYMQPVASIWYGVDPLAEKYPNVSPYCYTLANPVRFIDSDGRQIVGVTKKDAQNFRDDVYKVLADDKFSGVRELITIKGNKFNKIDGDALTKALDGVTLSVDERTYIDMVTNTINSKDVHKVEYVNVSGDVSLEGGNAINDHFKNNNLPSPLTPDGTLKAATLSFFGGEGFNTPTKKGSHSVIISGVSGSNTERAVTSGHEVFGHGIPSARRESDVNNNTNAIRTDNLIRRILGLPQRDGSDHAGGSNGGIVDPQKLPRTQ